MRCHCPVLVTAAVGLDFPRYRRRRPVKTSSDRSQRFTRSYATRDLFTLTQRQPQRRPRSCRDRTPPSRRQQPCPDRCWRPIQRSCYCTLGLSSLPPIPQLAPLRLRQPNHRAPPTRQLSSKVMQRPPEVAADMGGVPRGSHWPIASRLGWVSASGRSMVCGPPIGPSARWTRPVRRSRSSL